MISGPNNGWQQNGRFSCCTKHEGRCRVWPFIWKEDKGEIRSTPMTFPWRRRHSKLCTLRREAAAARAAVWVKDQLRYCWRQWVCHLTEKWCRRAAQEHLKSFARLHNSATLSNSWFIQVFFGFFVNLYLLCGCSVPMSVFGHRICRLTAKHWQESVTRGNNSGSSPTQHAVP